MDLCEGTSNCYGEQLRGHWERDISVKKPIARVPFEIQLVDVSNIVEATLFTQGARF